MNKKIISIAPNHNGKTPGDFTNYNDRVKIHQITTIIGRVYISADDLDLENLLLSKFVHLNTLLFPDDFTTSTNPNSREEIRVFNKINVILPMSAIESIETHEIYKSRLRSEE